MEMFVSGVRLVREISPEMEMPVSVVAVLGLPLNPYAI